MEIRIFGRTGHKSTVAIFGAVALGQLTQSEADSVMEQVIAAGVTHIDVAPSYGKAEERLGPWMPRERKRFFLGCKTTNRTKEGAAAELHQSLKRLQIDAFDLYQFHAVTKFDELDLIFGKDGAMQAVQESKDAGLTRYIGITGHGIDAPAIFLEALRRYDFDSVLFPINFMLYANPYYRKNAEELLITCHSRNIGTMIIKSIAEGPWGDQPQTHHTWYKPFTTADIIQKSINFVLSQDVTGICTAGDYRVLPLCLQACQNYQQLTLKEQEQLIATAGEYEPLFT